MWQPLFRLRFRGHELEVTGLLFDCSLEIYNRHTTEWEAFNRDAEYAVRGSGDTIYLRKVGVTEMNAFQSMVINEYMGNPFAALPFPFMPFPPA